MSFQKLDYLILMGQQFIIWVMVKCLISLDLRILLHQWFLFQLVTKANWVTIRLSIHLRLMGL